MSMPLYAFIFALVALIVYRLSKVGQRPAGCPPGPPTLPIIGNLHLMPKERAWLQFQKWADEYGPVYSLIVGTKVMVILSSDQVVKDLLDKRSNIYSSRPDNYLGNVVSGGMRMGLMDQEYGSTWRMIRKIIHNSLNINVSRSYVPYQDLENKAMLVGLLETPALFVDHIRRYSNSLTTQMVFGFRTTSINDPKLLQLYQGFDKFAQFLATESAALLDLYPLLRKLPDFALPSRRYAKRLHVKECELYLGHYRNAKNAIKNKTAKPSFCVDLVRAQDQEGFSDKLAAYVSGSLLEAGSDTTSSTLIGFVQAMILFPEVAKAAQAELDRVCGDRFPTLDDEPNLPYIRACVKESLRWMPTAVAALPHAVIRDDEYLGFKIPKGASVICNTWGIHMDPKRHPEPRRFNPVRYINHSQTAIESANNADPTKRDHFVFGAGRRSCQGMHIAERSLFFAISRMLWAFDFHAVHDAQGVEIKPDAEDLRSGLLIQPKPFLARIVPRSVEKATSVKAEWSKMERLLDDDHQWQELPTGLVWKEYELPAETA
ncbi:cytochrome P450 [Phaeosphaeriaceae sp. PMI808]|nr:cytochrome P450 [Phaeosphaeriaceae sp. PMI808]